MRANTKDEISFAEIILGLIRVKKLLFEKRKYLFLAMLAGALLGLLVSYIVKPLYKAELTFVLENSGNTKLGGYGGLAAQFGLNVGETGGMFQDEDNIIALIKSRTMITRTLLSASENELLIHRYLKSWGYYKEWTNSKALADINFSGQLLRVHDSVLGIVYKRILEKNLTVDKPDKKLDIVAVQTKASDERFAKNFTETLIKNVIQFYTDVQTKKEQENVSILKHQVDSVRRLLNDAITGVAVTSEAYPNINPALQRLKVPSQRRLVDVEMNKAILTELVKNLEVAEITLRRQTPLVQIIDNPVLPLEKQDLRPIKGMIIGAIACLLLSIFLITLKSFFKAKH